MVRQEITYSGSHVVARPEGDEGSALLYGFCCHGVEQNGLVVAQRGDEVKAGHGSVDWTSSQLATTDAVRGYALRRATLSVEAASAQ